MREPSRAEAVLCERLRSVFGSLPSQAAIDESEDFRVALTALEWFLPEVVDEIHPECPALDGVYPAYAQKHSHDEIEIIGICCLMSQELTPLHVQLQLAESGDYVSWLECRLGEKVDGGMRKEPYRENIVLFDKLHVMERLDSLDWFYEVGYGERRTADWRAADRGVLAPFSCPAGWNWPH